MSVRLCTCCDWSEKKSYEELAIAAFGSWGSVTGAVTVGADFAAGLPDACRHGAEVIMELMVVWLLLGAMTSLLVVAGAGHMGHLVP